MCGLLGVHEIRRTCACTDNSQRAFSCGEGLCRGVRQPALCRRPFMPMSMSPCSLHLRGSVGGVSGRWAGPRTVIPAAVRKRSSAAIETLDLCYVMLCYVNVKVMPIKFKVSEFSERRNTVYRKARKISGGLPCPFSAASSCPSSV